MDNNELNAELLKDWTKQYSKSRKRDYYFNSKTGESLWTLEEVKEKVLKENKNKNLTSNSIEKPTSSKTSLLQDVNSYQESVIQMNIDEDDYVCDPMDIEIVENICKIRFDSASSKMATASLNINSESLQPTLAQTKLLLVVDTNIFLSNLDQLISLLESYKNEILISVPWIVLQELDYLKSSKKNSSPNSKLSMSNRARTAIQFISDILNSRNDSFLFESSMQNEENCDLIKCESNDDRIIKCALRHSIEFPNLHVFIITNDKNLINKSCICKINATNFNGLKVNILTWIQNSIKSNSTKSKSISPTQQLANNANQSILYTDRNLNSFIDKIADVIEYLLIRSIQRLLAHFYQIEMTKAYQEIWQDLLLHKPPWNFKQLLANVDKSFAALFCFDRMVNSKTITEKYNCFKDGYLNYEKLENPLLYSIKLTDNNQKRLEKLRVCVKLSSNFVSFLDCFEKSSFDHSFQDLYKNLELIISYGVRYCNIGFILDTIDSNAEALYEHIHDTNTNLSIFEPLWLRFNDLSSVTRESIMNLDAKLTYYYLICNESINDFVLFFENCIKEQNQANLLCLTHSMYLLYKTLDIDQSSNQNQLDSLSDELNKFVLMKSNLINCFNLSNMQLLENGYYQLKEFQNRFKSINKDCFN